MTVQYAFDIEVFPNLFSAMFLRADTETDLVEISKNHGIKHPDVKTFVFASDFLRNDIKKLAGFLDGDIELIGFNNRMYDEPVMDYVISHHPTNKEIFEFSSGLIERMNIGGYNSFERQHEWAHIDLMKMMAFDALGVSLKQSSINLQWHRVQDLPYRYDHMVASDEVSKILDYNLNDVLITTRLYERLHKEIALRRQLSKEYGINLMSASDSRMANLMLESIYTKDAGVSLGEITSLRTERELVWLRECVGKSISFKTKKLQALKRKIDNTVVVSENRFAFKEKISFGNCDYDIGVGGLHSVDEPGRFYTDDNFIIQDADVASYYPNIMLNNNIAPAHLDHNFIDILGRITRERVLAKKTDKTKADGLKITINSIFGKLNSDTFWLQDAKAMLSVTLSGQLYLLMLVEELAINGIMTISANTDGIVCRIPRELESKYYEVCKWWEETTDFDLDYTPYAMYVRSDVNNYITEKPSGETKEKGRYVKSIGLKKGYRHPIIPRALNEYFVRGIPVSDTLKESKNILDFCVSQKSGGKFTMEFHKDSKIEELQKNNRFFVSTDGGKLIKRNKKTDKTIGLFVSQEVVILNDWDSELDISQYHLDYSFYEEEAMKYISDVETSSFDTEFIREELSTESPKPLVKINKNAKIVPAKFRFSGGAYIYNEADEKIYRGVAPINYLTANTGETLLSLKDNEYPTFLEFLVHNDEEVKLNSRQMNILMTIGFFDEFGGRKKLLKFYDEFRKGKFRYSSKHKDKTKVVRLEELSRILDEIADEDFTIREIIESEGKIFGKLQRKIKGVHPMIVLVTEVIEGEWSPKIKVQSLGKGTSIVLKIKKKFFAKKKLHVGQVYFMNILENKENQYPHPELGWDEPIKTGTYTRWIEKYREVTCGIEPLVGVGSKDNWRYEINKVLNSISTEPLRDWK